MTSPTHSGRSDGGTCRFCRGPLRAFLDLGASPPCEAFLSASQVAAPETFYPLTAAVCETCFLVQLPECVTPQNIFTEYAYFSGFSDAWVEHARRYAERMIDFLGLGQASRVVELGSNDGYLLQFFVRHGIKVLGIDPAANVAKAAEARGVRTRVAFFGADTAGKIVDGEGPADLIVGNNVLAQVPDLNDFVEGIRLLLAPEGMITLEFPHLLRTFEGNQFDQFYHEHYSYFSALTIDEILAAHGLRMFDVEQLWTHGGSLRVFACHAANAARPTRPAVRLLIMQERDMGLDRPETYADFTAKVQRTKRNLLRFLIDAKESGQTVAGYGAPGKGNTLLNYCGIRSDLLDYTVDRNPYKHGKFLPGTRIPVYAPERISETRPDYVLILPWNLRDEIAAQLAFVRQWGARFVVPIPELTVF